MQSSISTSIIRWSAIVVYDLEPIVIHFSVSSCLQNRYPAFFYNPRACRILPLEDLLHIRECLQLVCLFHLKMRPQLVEIKESNFQPFKGRVSEGWGRPAIFVPLCDGRPS